jgi:4-hydroxybenzoate polyprenyltransferase
MDTFLLSELFSLRQESMRKKIIAYFQLLRFHAAASESVLILLGALLMGSRDIFLLSILFVVALCYHIFGYVLNDYADIMLDTQSSDLAKKPLVSGLIPKKHALYLIVFGLVASYVLTLVYFRAFVPLIFLTIAILLGGIYDIYGKRVPGVSDFIIAGSLMFAYFFGASAVSISFTTLVYIVGGLIFIAVVFVNVVEGGLKDVDHDFLTGGKTLAILLGVKTQEGRLFITKRFIGFAYGLITILLLLMLFLFMQPELDLFHGKYLQLTVVVVLIAIFLVLCVRFLSMKVFDRAKIKRMYAIINSFAAVLLLIVIFPIIGLVWLVVLLALPATWYVVFNLVLYGKPLQPGV